MNYFRISLFALCPFVCCVAQSVTALAADRPNVVMIMTDNHGAWTLGCYGNEDIRTPNIDRLAQEGTLFENAFASNPVCSPTRASVLTGLIPSQHGVHCFLRGGRLQTGPDARCTLDEFRSMPEILKDNGYRCGLVGKWHLGGNMSPQEGFDDYWITTPHGGTSTFYGAQVIEDGKLRPEPEYLTDFWTRHAVNFLEQQNEESPFFLFLSYNGPYSLSRLLLREGKNRHADFYRDKPLPSFPREKTHPWQLHNRDYINNPISISRVATEVSGVDDGVGTVMKTLQERGFDDNTIVIFLADQGWVGGHGGFFGMGDHTQPVTAVDGMMKIPMIWRQPEKIAAGRRSKQLVANYDVLPTLLQTVGIDEEVKNSPGNSFDSELAPHSSAADVAADEAIFYEFESLRCIRTHRWKYTHRFPNGPHELFDLENDPDEFVNLYMSDLSSHHSPSDEPRRVDGREGRRPPGSGNSGGPRADSNNPRPQTPNSARPRHAEHDGYVEIQRQLKQRLDDFFAKNAAPKYDLWNGGGAQTVIYDGIEEEAAQLESTPPPALPDGFEPHEFTLPDDFTAELIAGPPLVTHPTMGCFDDRGRLFVCNNAGVNMSAEELEKNLPNEICMLEDRDGDGRFDQSTVFADKMTFPMGGAWHDGALYVASPPNIWRLEDTDDDGVADKRDIIVDKFGYTGNAASIHGCFFSPDGRLYWCDGFHGHEVKDEDGNIKSKRKGSYIFSCRPDGSDIRIHCGGGMDNPVEVDFTDTGDVIGTVNILYTRPRVDCLVHWQYGGAYPHRESFLDEWPVTGNLLGPIHRFGHVAISGTTRYRSGTMNYRWRDNFFATFFNLGRVVRLELEPHGSTYSATQREFLSCSNRDFHPTDVIEDADGSLLVVDTGGWFYRGCPTSQIARPDVLGGIYRIRRTGMTTVPDPRGLRTDWTERSKSRLMRDLKDTRFEVREKVIQECVRRGDDVVPDLARAVKSADIVARKNALWALNRILQRGENTEARAAVRLALSDRDAAVRQIACRIVANHPDDGAKEALMRAVGDKSSAVRRAAWMAWGRLRDRETMAAMAAFSDPKKSSLNYDRSERHARSFAMLSSLRDGGELAFNRQNDMLISRLANSEEELIVYEQMFENGVAVPYLQKCLERGTPDVVRMTANIISKRMAANRLTPEEKGLFDDAAKKRLLSLVAVDEGGFAVMLSTLLSTFGERDFVPSLVAEMLANDRLGKERQVVLLQALAGTKVASTLELEDQLLRLLSSKIGDLKAAAIPAAGAVATDKLLSSLVTLGTDEQEPEPFRLAALKATRTADGQCDDQMFEMFLNFATNGSSAERRVSTELIATVKLNVARKSKIAAILAEVGPQQLRGLVPLFRGVRDEKTCDAFLRGLENSRSLTSLPMLDLSEVVKRFPQEFHQRANGLLDRLRDAEEQKLRKLDSLIGQLSSGDATRGQEVFFSEKAKCATCHVIGDKGKRVGPDLTSIGANRSEKDLLESILFPSSTIVRQYEPWSVVTTAGKTHNGLIVRDATDEVTIQQSSGDRVMIPRSEIEELVQSTVSLMPKGLDEQLSPQQIVDIVAFLKQQTTSSASSSKAAK